jgi:hypothetical protein
MVALRVALIVVVVALSGGCQNRRTLVVHPSAQSNHHRRFYLVVRALKDDQEFIGDGYQRIAEMVFAQQRDPSVKLVKLVKPGRDAKLQLTVPGDQSFGVYALFTEPSESWRAQVVAPLKGRYDVYVEGNRVSVRGPDGKSGDGSSITATDVDNAADEKPDEEPDSGDNSSLKKARGKAAKAGARGLKK